MEDCYEYAERCEEELQERLALERKMVGNAAPSPLNEPSQPMTWGEIGKMIVGILVFIAGCVIAGIAVIANILGYI